MGIIINSVCSTTFDLRIYNPVKGKSKVTTADGEHGVTTSTVAEIDSIDSAGGNTPSCAEGGALNCKSFSKGMSGDVLETQVTIASDGGQGASPYVQKITTRVGVF